MNDFIQLSILICSGAVAFLLGSFAVKVRRVGFIFGLAGQPFWFITSWQNEQWAILILAFWYTYCHARGLYNTLEKPEPPIVGI